MRVLDTFHGTGRLLRLNLRVDRIRGSVWVLGIVGLVLTSTWSVRNLYSTPDEIARYASMLTTSRAMESVNRAFNGPGLGFEHPNPGVVLVNEVALWGSVAFSLMAIFLTARHTRAAEEAGQLDLVRSQSIGRHAPLGAAALLVLLLEAIAAAIVLLGLVLLGYDTTGSTALVLAFFAAGCVFSVLTAIGAQIVSTGRAAVGIGLAAFGSAFVLRAIGDVGDGCRGCRRWGGCTAFGRSRESGGGSCRCRCSPWSWDRPSHSGCPITVTWVPGCSRNDGDLGTPRPSASDRSACS